MCAMRSDQHAVIPKIQELRVLPTHAFRALVADLAIRKTPFASLKESESAMYYCKFSEVSAVHKAPMLSCKTMK